MARASPPSLPWRGFLTIVSSTLSPFGSEHASTTERAVLAGGRGADGEAVGRDLRAEHRDPVAQRADREHVKAVRADGETARIVERPRRPALERGQPPHTHPAVAAVGVQGARRGIELHRQDRVAARGRDPEGRASRGGTRVRAGRSGSVEGTQPGCRRVAGQARDARERAGRRIAPERQHGGVVGTCNGHGGAVGRDGDGRGGCQSADRGCSRRTLASLRQPDPGGSCVERPGRDVALERRQRSRRST